MALSIVESNKFIAYCDEYLCSERYTHPSLQTKFYSCWFLSLFGAPVALRAIWANLIKGNAGLVSIRPLDEMEALNNPNKTIIASVGREGVGWRSHGPRRLPNAYNSAHMIIYNKMLEVEHNENHDFLLISSSLGQTIDQHYQHLNYQSSIPLHESWKEYLWNLTQEQEWATPLFGHERSGWFCRPDYDFLSVQIQEDIASGKLKTI